MRSTILWADDDSQESLQFLARILERSECDTHRVEGYADAISVLESCGSSYEKGFSALLVDVILPAAEGVLTLTPYLGVEVAERAAVLGLRKVCFLTVIPRSEILDQLKGLTDRFEGLRLEYFDKVSLLSPGKLEALIQFLKEDANAEGAGKV